MDTGREDSILAQNLAAGSDLRRKEKTKHPCNGCYYFGGKAESVKSCNFYLITGIRRPCDAGESCTVRKDGAQSRRKPASIKKLEK